MSDEKGSSNEKFDDKLRDPIDQWGYDMYPERKGVFHPQEKSWLIFGKGKVKATKLKCEQKVVTVLKESPILKTLMGAMRKSGCDVDFRRHITVEVCAPLVTGGYDPKLNQIVICHNTAYSKGLIHSVLMHEFIHMYDYCVHNLDFKNAEHLACTEVRACNLTYCSFLSAIIGGFIAPMSLKAKHKECVRTRAIDSVLAVRDISKEEATAAVDKVFDKCYNDLEPIGRRLRRNSVDPDLVYAEGFLYGYD